MNKPLSHVRVLELSRILAGPWAGQLLGDLGAQVIKVERPGQGDDTRQWGPPFLKDKHGNDTTESAYYLAANRGKQSITIDITCHKERQILVDLVKKSDVLIENYKAGGLKKYGLDYESLAAINPELIYCSITGFGHSGPYQHRAGYDFMIQAMGGLMSVTGEQDHLPGGGPQKVGVALADILTGLYATVAVQGALIEREQSGQGQHIDLALLDVQAATLANQAMNYLVGGEVPTRLGNAHPNIVPYQVFETRDGHMVLAVGNDQQFRQFCQVAGCEPLARQTQYATNPQRVKHREQLCKLIGERISQRTTAQWLEQLQLAGVPCGPINRVDQVFADPQILARNMRIDLPHPLSGTVPQVGNPIRFSRTPIEFEQPAPLLGQHGRQILSEVLGYSEQKIHSLLKASSS